VDTIEHNRLSWNRAADTGNKWTIPVSHEEVAEARNGRYAIVLTPHKPVPREWLGDLGGKEVLCLASGGGQQGPILAAAGASVTVFDNSDEQLKRDQRTADANALKIQVVQGNMQDLGCFADGRFDLVVHPVSNLFVNDIRPVWKECYRVLRKPGALLSGFTNPLIHMIDWEDADRRQIAELRNAIPYSDCESLPPPTIQRYREEMIPFEYGHSLTDQIQGQIDAGFLIAGFYEDKGEPLLDRYTEVFMATRAIKI
jgi:SAM-dependent methyltransferase